jgi:hypothetical protein
MYCMRYPDVFSIDSLTLKLVTQSPDKRKRISVSDWQTKLPGVKIRKEDMNRLVMNFLVTEVRLFTSCPVLGTPTVRGDATEADVSDATRGMWKQHKPLKKSPALPLV